MSNATDSLIEAEEMIRSTFSKSTVDDVERSLQICRWLLGFNLVEKGFTVKCNRRRTDVSFCIDYDDCVEGRKRILTNIAAIGPPLKITFRTKNVLPHYKTGDHGWYYIDGRKMDMDVIKNNILESYEMKINELNLVSNVSSTNNALLIKQSHDESQDNSDLPNKEDVDAAESHVRKTSTDEVIGVEAVLDQVEINFKKAGKSLKENWREITRKNIEIWFAAINCKKL